MRQREEEREREREKNRKEKEKKREKETKMQGTEKRNREQERERNRETQTQKKFRACSTSLSGGNQVDGLPPVVHNETDQTARPMAKRLSVKYDNSFQFLMMI